MNDSDPISTYELNNDSVIAMIKTGGNSQAPGLGGLGGLGGQMDDPLQQQALNAVLNNPQMLNQLLNSPEIRPLLQNNPNLRQVLQNPQLRQLLLNPNLLKNLGNLGRGGNNPFAGLGMPQLRPSSTPNTRLGELFTQWMDNEKNGQAQPQRQEQPRVPVGGINVPQANPQPVFQQIPQPDPNVDYKEKYKDQIAQIKEMGIDDEEKIINALKICD